MTTAECRDLSRGCCLVVKKGQITQESTNLKQIETHLYGPTRRVVANTSGVSSHLRVIIFCCWDLKRGDISKRDNRKKGKTNCLHRSNWPWRPISSLSFSIKNLQNYLKSLWVRLSIDYAPGKYMYVLRDTESSRNIRAYLIVSGSFTTLSNLTSLPIKR